MKCVDNIKLTIFGQCTSMNMMLQWSLTGPLVEGCHAMAALQRHLDAAKLLPHKNGHCSSNATQPKHVLVPFLFCRGKRVDLREVEPQQKCFWWSWSGFSSVQQGPEAPQAPSSIAVLLQFSSRAYCFVGKGLRHEYVRGCNLSFRRATASFSLLLHSLAS